MHSRRGRRRTAALTLAATLLLPVPALGSAPAAQGAGEPPGPQVTLPFSNSLYPYPTTGSAGPDALNSLVAQECNGGARLADQQWFTLPSEGSGLLAVRAQRAQWWGAARSPDYTRVGTAVVDHGTGQVLGCGHEPVSLEEGQQRSLVAWSDPAVLDECGTYPDECYLESLEVFANWTSGPPANDRWQDAKPITAVPYRGTVDTLLADSDGPTLSRFCFGIDPYDANTAWWRFTPTVSGALPLFAEGETYGPPTNQAVFGPEVAIGRLTESGPVALPQEQDEDCESTRMAEVEAGRTYLISVYDYADDYYGSSLVHGGRATLTVGALRPLPPQDVTGTAGDRKVVLSWSAPQSPGSSAITGYQVRRLPSGPTVTLPADTTTYTAAELTNGQAYAFEVTALNSSGPGNPARTAPVTPTFDTRLPTEPTGIGMLIDGGARTATITWSPPASSGSSSVTGYRVTRSGTDSTGGGPVSTLLSASARSYTFTNLKAGTRYDITLRAVNSTGNGRPYEDFVLIYANTPSAPQQVTATAGARSAFVSWQRPYDIGSSWPTGYRVRRYVGSSTTPQATTTVSGETYSLAVTGLTPGTAYRFDVTAINESGAGEPSERTAPVTPTTVALVPSAPTSVSAVQGSTTGTATLHWQPPVFDGGSVIIGYRLARDGRDTGGAGPWSTTLPASARSHTFTHLNAWDTYTFTVEAINAAGTGPAAGRAVTITASTPSAPTSVKATPGDASATITWRPPLQPAHPGVTGYRIRTYVGANTTASSSTTVGAAARKHTVTGLTNGTAYRFDVTAINSSGTGRASDRTTAVTPVTVPGAPTIGTATSGTSGGAITATAAWSPPSSTGGTAITGYRVTALRVNAAGDVLSSTVSALQPASARSLSMTLPQTGNYQFTVQAVNAAGTGAASGRSNVVAGR